MTWMLISFFAYMVVILVVGLARRAADAPHHGELLPR